LRCSSRGIRHPATGDGLSEASIAPPSPWRGCRHGATAAGGPAHSNLLNPLQ
ncbi:hypothetical protein BAE44_0002445, partial [Dichanthelium oligosanthes]